MNALKLGQTRPLTTGNRVVVAVLDTGSHPHPDIRRNLLAGSDQTSSEGRNGKSDQNGHGTRMAGLIAGHGHGSSSGIQGIAPAARILPVVVTKTGREIDPRIMARGVQWATTQKASVINISSGGGPSFDLADAIDAAISEDVVVVAAAGNTSSEAIVNYPAAFDDVLAVGATGRSGQHSSTSVKGDRVKICAPGVDIISTQPSRGYGTATGTSDSTAIVSGAAALVRSRFPDLSAKEVVHRLTATADDIGPPGRDDECGFGRLNIVKALTAEVPPLEGGGAPPASNSAPPSAGATAVRPGGSSPSATARGEQTPAGNGRGWVLGGAAGGLVLVGVLVGLGIRRRRRG
ncbi:S8 family serine peptidase [Actinoplanes solisilvae]|uniref:S8 family serine peptidase n=1 Tax=Actinoplanes solisilvae TaxID=2486853 RepID=UPI0013E2F806